MAVMVTLAANVALVIPSAVILSKSCPTGLAPKPKIWSLPKPAAANTNVSLPATPPLITSLPPPPVRTSLPAPPTIVLASVLPVPAKLPLPPKNRFSTLAPRV
ncbi:hypothetical protein D3C76_1225210 [compost metagenome]